MENLTQTRPRERAKPTGTARSEAIVVLVGTGLAVLAWAAAKAAGIELVVKSGSGTREVALGSVIVAPLLVGALAVGLLRLLERRTSKALRIWTIVAMTVWALSVLGPVSATTVGAGLVLASMHLLVGGVVVAGLRLTRAERARVA